jgi:hypothetical protein
MKMVGKTSIFRLALAKLLYMNAAETGTIVERVVSIHNLDLAIEITLKTLATELSVRLPNPVNFPTLWKLVEGQYYIQYHKMLPSKSDIFSIHDKRNSVQHHGSVPSDTDLRQCKSYAFGFLDEVFLTLTGLHLHQVFLSSLIDNTELRQMMELAERDVSSDPKDSMYASMRSFMWAKILAQRQLGYFDPTLGAFDTQDRLQRAMKEPIREVANRIVDHLFTLELGFDTVTYGRINKIAPFPLLGAGITKPADVHLADTLPSNYTEDNAWICYNFVLETILKWQDRRLL